jgi:hypothetical protein
MDKIYKVYKSQLIIDNHKEFCASSKNMHEAFKRALPEGDSTWSYTKYNIFNLAACKPKWHQLYSELIACVKDFTGDPGGLWIQCWLNYHTTDTLETELTWHKHYYPWHGYIAIEPHKTRTVFMEEDIEIQNEIGNIYIGLGDIHHRVEQDAVFDGPRITLGFDIALAWADDDNTKKTGNLGFIPII